MKMKQFTAFCLLALASSQTARALDCSKVPGRIQDVGMANLEALGREVEAGKRDDRDSYIILNQLNFSYQMRHLDDTPEGKRVKELHSALAKKHPEFPSMSNWRLSDTIACDEQNAKEAAELAAKKKEEEERPRPGFGRMLLYGNKMALHTDHPRSLRFFSVPANHSVLCLNPEGGFRDQRGGSARGGACFATFCAEKDVAALPSQPGHAPAVSCRHPIRPEPESVVTLQDWVAIKSPGHVNLEAPFFLATTEFRGAGEGGAITPKDPFARIYSIDGKVLYDFALKSEAPASIVSGLGVDKSGAIVGIGEFVSFDNGCDNETSPHKMRKLYVWESGGTNSEIDSSTQTPAVSALMSRFRIHEAMMPWFDWSKNNGGGAE